MQKLILALVAIIAAVSAFKPIAHRTTGVQLSMKNDMQKIFGAGLIASTVLTAGMPVFAAEGDGARVSIFGSTAQSTPFTVQENREDPLYSPYSAYGNGEAAVYKKGGKDELSFYSTILKNSVDRTKKIPDFINKKQWSEVQTLLVRYNYNQREAMLRLAESAKDPKAATKAAKTYFQDINDINEYSLKKNPTKCMAAYDASVKDLASYQSLL